MCLILTNLTGFSSTGDGFRTLGLDGSAGRSKEAGAFCQRTTLFADWLQKDFILAREEQTLQADKALLESDKDKIESNYFLSSCISCFFCPHAIYLRIYIKLLYLKALKCLLCCRT